jgi:hypothetical protein
LVGWQRTFPVGVDAKSLLVAARDNAGARRHTLRRGAVGLGHQRAAGGQPMHVWHIDLVAQIGRVQIVVTVIVGNDEDDVRAVTGRV